ncbi:MAG TPA: hypothetical protein VL137_04355, partial [Polyangiaceae bacterium]|nr:hypothetical protein [Polyangiaceae bacterium]
MTHKVFRLAFWGAAAAVLFAACGGNSSTKTNTSNHPGQNGDASLDGAAASGNGNGGAAGNGNGSGGTGHGGTNTAGNAGVGTGDSGTTDGAINPGGNGPGGNGADGGGVGTVNPATCHDVAGSCTSNGQCCSGACDPTNHVCIKTPGVCLGAGEVCSAGTDCCTFACVGGKCGSQQCTADGENCSTDDECCGGTCGAGGTCTPLSGACNTSGNPCNNHSDCCSNYCLDGLCSTPSYCTQSGDTCSTDQQCCAGLCQKAQGASLGLCGLVPASGAGSCLSAGEVCSGGATYDGMSSLPTCGGECCSKACFPYGPTGVLICQPPSGCHPTGEICTDDVDCCGSETRPDGDTSHITCNK